MKSTNGFHLARLEYEVVLGIATCTFLMCLIPSTVLYIPQSHVLEETLEREAELRIDKLVLVQPSKDGHDKSGLIDGLRRMAPPHARALVAFDPVVNGRCHVPARISY